MVNRVVKFAAARNELPHTNAGKRLIDVYKLEFNEDGSKDLVVVDHKDIYMEIQSHAASCDIHNIIEKCMITGDPSPLYKTEGYYGDLAEMPKSRIEALQMLEDANNLWKGLPVEVKQKFDNDVSKFFATAFTDTWVDKIGIVKEEKKEDIKESEGIVNE